MESTNSQPADEATHQEIQALVEEIVAALQEPKSGMVRVVVRTIGVERARAFLEQTLEVEARGGLMLTDGSRRRTPGGVFFYLVRGGVNPQERRRIFPRTAPNKKKKKPQQTPTSPQPSPPLLWEEREPYVSEAFNEAGRAASVKLTIIGRPQRVVEAKTSVITVFQNPELPKSLPKGLPTPAETQTNYAVFIATKQWNAVSASLQEHDDDALIIEGYPFFEPKLSGMAVLAQKVTTKYLEQARKAKRQADSSSQ